MNTSDVAEGGVWDDSSDCGYFTPNRLDGSELTDTDWYIAGGSSGGSAVAVATGAVFGSVNLQQ